MRTPDFVYDDIFNEIMRIYSQKGKTSREYLRQWVNSRYNSRFINELGGDDFYKALTNVVLNAVQRIHPSLTNLILISVDLQ